jgi:hypothetical protein
MRPYLIGGACILLVYIFYRFLSSILASRRHAQNAARLGCKPPARRPIKLPFGIDLAWRVMKASQERRVPDMFLEVYEELGWPKTWVQYFLGSDTISTVDPKNIQAILATQFNDFAIGRIRRLNFLPVLGNGIFTVDGRAWYVWRDAMSPQCRNKFLTHQQGALPCTTPTTIRPRPSIRSEP